VARPRPGDELGVSGDDLLVVPRGLAPEIAGALASPRLRRVRVGEPQSDTLESGGKLLITFRALEHTQDWVVGIIVPEAYYTRELSTLRRNFLGVYAAVSLLVFIAGGLVLRQLRRGLGSVVETTARMRALDFSPSPERGNLRDIAEISDELERAKTSMRALGKYVPLDLVRELYRANQEPALGGQLRELSLMFTDIEGFTSLSEKLAPAALAEALGRYLEVMIAGVRSSEGTVDKFIGDAVMAFWNAPRHVDDHAKRACRAVIACMKATSVLFASLGVVCLRCSRATGCTRRR
jgi:adenylate cyclase